MPADEPDVTTGAARGGGPVRPRHHRRGDDRPRHARGADVARPGAHGADPDEAASYADWYGGGDPYSDWYAGGDGPDQRRADPHPTAGSPAGPHTAGAGPVPTAGAYDDRYAHDADDRWYEPPQAAYGHPGDRPSPGRTAADGYGTDGYGRNGVPAAGQDGGRRFDPRQEVRATGDRYVDDRYAADPDAGRHPADQYGADRFPPGRHGADQHRADQHRADQDRADRHATAGDPSVRDAAGPAAPGHGSAGHTSGYDTAGYGTTAHTPEYDDAGYDDAGYEDAGYEHAGPPRTAPYAAGRPGAGRVADAYDPAWYGGDAHGEHDPGATGHRSDRDPGRADPDGRHGGDPRRTGRGRAHRSRADPAEARAAGRDRPGAADPADLFGADPAPGAPAARPAAPSRRTSPAVGPSRPAGPDAGPGVRPDEPAAAGAEPGVATTGGWDLRLRSARAGADPGPPTSPGMPSRRPGDPPGVPAELFVETTAETPALRLDDEPAPAEPAPEGGRPGRRRTPQQHGAPGWRGWVARLTGGGPGETAGHGHGHGHGHGPARPAGRRVRILLAALLVPCALATLVGVLVLWPSGGPPATAQPISQEPVRAQVTAVRATDCTPGSGAGDCLALIVRMADGPLPGRDLVQVVPVEPGSPRFAVGDQVVLGWSGADPEDAGSYQIVDFQRGAPLAWLAALFAAAVLLLGRWRGLAALAALGLSFAVLLFFVLPAILAGRDPLAVAVVGSCLIMFAVLYLTHGPSARTSTAALGTLLSLALIGGLGAAFSAATKLTGLDDQTSNLIASLGTGVDARGLLLAGVVIGALGVLDDVTVTQTSAVWELRQANPRLGARGLFAAAMRIGRDHVAAAVNTLVLAYAGAALPLLLLFSLSGRGLGEVVTAQDVATEVVRTLVGSIGLVASVPITTALAAAVAVRETVEPAEADAA